MGGGGKGGGTTVQSTQIPPEVLARYNSVNAQAEQVASTPYQAYTGEFVAPINQTQQAGIDATTAASQAAQPYYGAATGQLGQAQQQGQQYLGGATGAALGAAMPVNPGGLNVGQYMNPYTQSVVNATQAALGQQFGQQNAAQQAQAIQAGAFGGERAGLQQAQLQGQQALAASQAISPLYQANYTQALGAAQQQQGVNLAAQQANRTALQGLGTQLATLGQQGYAQGSNTANQLAALGSGAQTAGLAGAQAQIAAGTLGQQTQQAQDTALYNQYMQAMGFPYQQTQFLANIAEGTGALSGNTITNQQSGGYFSSDERLKKNIEHVGKLNDGQNIYRYQYKDDPENNTHIGVLGQEALAKNKPGIGLDPAGYLAVNYHDVTDDAAHDGKGLVPNSMGGAVLSAGNFARGGYADGGMTLGDLIAAHGSSAKMPGLGVGIPNQAASAALRVAPLLQRAKVPGVPQVPGTMTTQTAPGNFARGGYADGGSLADLLAAHEAMYPKAGGPAGGTGLNINSAQSSAPRSLQVQGSIARQQPQGQNPLTQAANTGEAIGKLANMHPLDAFNKWKAGLGSDAKPPAATAAPATTSAAPTATSVPGKQAGLVPDQSGSNAGNVQTASLDRSLETGDGSSYTNGLMDDTNSMVGDATDSMGNFASDFDGFAKRGGRISPFAYGGLVPRHGYDIGGDVPYGADDPLTQLNKDNTQSSSQLEGEQKGMQQKVSSSGGGGDNTLGDIAAIGGDIAKVVPFFFNKGGSVNPFAYGGLVPREHHADGSAVGDDDGVTVVPQTPVDPDLVAAVEKAPGFRAKDVAQAAPDAVVPTGVDPSVATKYAVNPKEMEEFPPEQQKLLQSIGAPESSGRYDIRYGGPNSAGKPFDPNGPHPNVPEPTKDGRYSTAAGYFQFTKPTWDETTGGAPMTSGYQNAGAWKLAQDEYQRQTGGDLAEDLKKNNGPTPDMLGALSGRWAGLQKYASGAPIPDQTTTPAPAQAPGLSIGRSGPGKFNGVPSGQASLGDVASEYLPSSVPTSESFWVPAASFLGGMLSSPNPRFLGALGSGLVAGVSGQMEYDRLQQTAVKNAMDVLNNSFEDTLIRNPDGTTTLGKRNTQNNQVYTPEQMEAVRAQLFKSMGVNMGAYGLKGGTPAAQQTAQQTGQQTGQQGQLLPPPVSKPAAQPAAQPAPAGTDQGAATQAGASSQPAPASPEDQQRARLTQVAQAAGYDPVPPGMDKSQMTEQQLKSNFIYNEGGPAVQQLLQDMANQKKTISDWSATGTKKGVDVANTAQTAYNKSLEQLNGILSGAISTQKIANDENTKAVAASASEYRKNATDAHNRLSTLTNAAQEIDRVMAQGVSGGYGSDVLNKMKGYYQLATGREMPFTTSNVGDYQYAVKQAASRVAEAIKEIGGQRAPAATGQIESKIAPDPSQLSDSAIHLLLGQSIGLANYINDRDSDFVNNHRFEDPAKFSFNWDAKPDTKGNVGMDKLNQSMADAYGTLHAPKSDPSFPEVAKGLYDKYHNYGYKGPQGAPVANAPAPVAGTAGPANVPFRILPKVQ